MPRRSASAGRECSGVGCVARALLQLVAELGDAVGIDHELLVAAELQGVA